MLSLGDANLLVSEHLGDTPRAAHSRFVAHVMRELAQVFDADSNLWEIAGLCHDLDFFETSQDRSQHGLLTLKWLGESIPSEARHAIAAHDHRTGVQADTLLADMLKVADATAVIDAHLGRRLLRNVDRNDPLTDLRRQLGDRPYLGDILEEYSSKHALPVARVLDIIAASSPQ